MKKLLFAAILLFAFGSISFAQEEKEVEVKKEKKIMIKIMDEDGKITTKVIEGDDFEGEENIWISEKGDSIKVEVEIEEDGGKKVIKKRIVIPDLEGLEGLEELKELEGLEGLKDLEKHIEIYQFDDEHHDGFPHMFFFEEGDHPQHGLLKEDFFFQKDNGPKKGKLGVYIEDAEKGVKVKEVIENSAAYSVGILAGDVITEINEKKMTNIEELIREVSSHKPGDMIEVELKRNGKKKEFNVRLHGESTKSVFRMPREFRHDIEPRIHEGVKKFKHHFYRGLEDCQKKCPHDKKHECEKKCMEEHKMKMEGNMKDMEMKLKKKMEHFEHEHQNEE